MRVIAGSAGGITLANPPESVRPTMDRVKEAIFSSLGEVVPEARVLDLFAGSGSLGIESLSRGATSAIFVESNARCVSSIRDNLRRTKLDGVVQTMDALRFLELYATEETFDLVFADPPYAKKEGDRDFGSDLLASPTLVTCLSSGGLFILERNPSGPPPECEGLDLIRARRYGDTEVVFYRKS